MGKLLDLTKRIFNPKDETHQAPGGLEEILDAFPYYVMLIDENHNIVLANKSVEQHLHVDRAAITGKFCPKAVHGIDGSYAGCPLEESVAHNGIVVERELFDQKMNRWLSSAIYPSTLRTKDGKKIFVHTTRVLEHVENEVRRNYDIQHVLNSLLSLQLRDCSIDDILTTTLDQILSIPWLSLRSQGAIFLVENEETTLKLKAQNKLADPICAACREVPFGRCLCGRAAQSGATEFADRLDYRHDIRYEGMQDHGHYCVPIVSSSHKVLGVINTYLKPGHKRETIEEDFLKAIANGLASIIEHRNMAKEKNKLQARLMQTEKMAAIGQLAGGVAHEINNPLGVILGFAQFAIKDMAENNDLYVPLQSIVRESVRCKQIINDLLMFSRVSNIAKEPAIVNDIIERTISITAAQAKVQNVQITKNYDAAIPQIMLNKNQMQQVIINICNNAIDAMPEGGTITITTKHCDTHISIDIADTGQGMSDEVKQRLFEPFFTTKEVGKGTGLGLSLCYEIIQKHRGTISATSVEGKGTRFSITLPLE